MLFFTSSRIDLSTIVFSGISFVKKIINLIFCKNHDADDPPILPRNGMRISNTGVLQ